MRKLGLGINFGMPEVSDEERIRHIAEVGFDAAFTDWKGGGYIDRMAELFRKNSLIFQSVHAPFKRVDRLWSEGDEGEDALRELCDCLDDCAANKVGIMVCHVWIGFGEEHPNDIGIERFARLLKRAEELGVTVAFENTEGEKYLEKVRDDLFSHPNAGFCIDTGHEMCYNRSQDMIGKYGKGGKLVATHLNDNMGITGKKITWHDDAHLLPGDGVGDWHGVAARLCGVGYDGILTSELTVKSKPERTVNDIYRGLDCRTYVRTAYERASRIAGYMDEIRPV